MTLRSCLRCACPRVRTFLNDTRAGATAIAAAAVIVMTVGAAALITDHLWLYDQRDTLKTAAEAASLAATLDIDRQLAKNPRIGDTELEAALLPVAKRYVLVNLAHLPPERLKRAKESLEVTLDLDRAQRTVGVEAKADLGGTLFSRNLPLLDNYAGPEKIATKAGVQSESTPVEVVLAIDVSGSMASDLRGVWSQTNSRLAIVQRSARDLVALLNPNGYNRVAVGIVPWYDAVRLDAAAAKAWADKDWVAARPGTGSPAWQGCIDSHHRLDSGTAKVPRSTAALLAPPDKDAPFVQAACVEHAFVTFTAGQPVIDKGFMPALLPLSTERAAIEGSVDALKATSGGTHSTLGVLWAQRLLEPAWKTVWGGAGIHPADPKKAEYAKLRKAIVLLTDGADANNLNGVSRTKACNVAKSRGTEIFVIAAMLPKDISGALGRQLRACSSESDKEYPAGTRRPDATYVFLDNATPANLEDTFRNVAKQLRTLRKVM